MADFATEEFRELIKERGILGINQKKIKSFLKLLIFSQTKIQNEYTRQVLGYLAKRPDMNNLNTITLDYRLSLKKSIFS